ncbi:sigma 54-interacting transcriptional regulator [Desulfosarcina sp.]|uniref:sigma 54-interacting transcriptional regulator n=1 Tax=Desulfosarcina sp. TaxID=2027861 RepID=UPI0039705AB9
MPCNANIQQPASFHPFGLIFKYSPVQRRANTFGKRFYQYWADLFIPGGIKMSPTDSYINEDFILRSLVEGTASETGTRFFRVLVKNISLALGTHGAWVAEYLPEVQRLRALAFWLGKDYIDHYEYDIVGTPCEPAIRKKTHLHIPENVVQLFPGDPDLPKMGAVSYMGYPLLSPEKSVLGNLAVLHTRPMPESFLNLALFQIFAARATAELLRLRAESEVRVQKEKLEGLFNGAMDAIVELDDKFNILMMNPAAERIFGCQRDQCIGRSFEQFATSKDIDRLYKIIRKLKLHPKDQRSVWVPEGLLALSADKKKIQAEATLSQIDSSDRHTYVLILRDVNERYEAQKMIEFLRDETEYLKDEIQSLYNLGEIIGESKAFRKTLQLAADVASTDTSVLICGETGTGKELIARAIHASSKRKDRPLITVNCAAIPETLMESEFFGHEKGAFTGATKRREGRFALADGGTIFLDEVGELNKELQAKLLRVLQEGEFDPVGSSKTRRTDVRVIAATNSDLSMAVQEGKFRTDLYYRLNVFPINIPPLKQREDDIRLLAEHFVHRFSARMGRKIDPLSVECVERLKDYDWPGNVRELQNVIERGVITARQGRLNLDHALPGHMNPTNFEKQTPSENGIKTIRQLQQQERENLLLALKISQWKIGGKKGAAQLVGIPPSTFQSRMKAMGIKRPYQPLTAK